MTWLLAIMVTRGWAADPIAHGWDVRQWTTEHGLPQNSVRALVQTHDGYLWLGTLSGLARFDGVNFTRFTRGDTSELESDTINALAEDPSGTLWIGTLDGLLEWRGNRVRKRWTRKEGLPFNDVQQLVICPTGGIWLRTGEAVALLKQSRVTTFSQEHGLVANNCRSIAPAREGGLLVVFDEGVQRLKADGDRFGPLLNWPSKGDWTVFEDSSGRLWCSSTGGSYQWSAQGWAHIEHRLGWPDERVHRFFEDRTAGIWITTEAGLGHLQDGKLEQFPIGNEKAQGGVIICREDHEGNVWVGTSGDGLFRLRPRRIRAWTTQDGLPDNHDVRSASAGPDGSVWVVTKRGVARIRNGRVQTFPEVSYMQPSLVYADRQGHVWLVIHGHGVFRFEGGEFIATRLPNTLGTFFTAVYEDRVGKIWIADRAITVYTDGKFEWPFGSEPIKDRVRAMLQDRNGQAWFGTRSGLHQFVDGRWRALTIADGLSDNRVTALHEDGEGAIWVGTENGLTRCKEGRLSRIGLREGLIEPVINQIFEDNLGNLWFGGLRGIYRTSRAQLNEVAVGRTQRVQCFIYGEPDGMASTETNGELQPAGCKTPDGHLWFPTGKGLVEVDPRLMVASEVAPTVVIEQVKSDEEIIFGDGCSERRGQPETGLHHRLGPGRARALEICYTANSLSAPERVRFKYKLEPIDRDWRDAGAQRQVFFTNLRAGNYTFRVQACNHHGLWNEAGDTFAFSLAPHFYETWPFYGLCAAVVGLAGFGLHHRRVGILRRIQRLEREQALQSERARIARDLHDDLGANLTGIALKADLAKRELSGSQPAFGQIAEIANSTRALVDQMRETVWALNPKHDSLESLALFLAQQVEDFVTQAGLRCRLEMPARLPAVNVPSDVRHHLCLAVKETIHNAVKHAGAKEIHFALEMANHDLCMRVIDDGRGFELDSAPTGEANGEASCASGNGLSNMRQRVRSLGGQFQLTSSRGSGTQISIRVPMASSGEAPSSFSP